jgi:hypothetical protein
MEINKNSKEHYWEDWEIQQEKKSRWLAPPHQILISLNGSI